MFVVGLRRWLALTVLPVAVVGCGGSEPSSASKSATIRVSARSAAAINFYSGTKTGATNRRVAIELHPHCVDRSRQLDCEGRYSFSLVYRFRDGEPNSFRCGEPQTSAFRFVVSGDAHAGATGTSDAMRVACDDGTPGTLVAQGVLAMADLTKTNWSDGSPPPAAFLATMRLSVDGEGIHYEWRSRDGADCTGQVEATGPAQTSECRWA